MISGWLRNRKRRKIVQQSFPSQWEKWIGESVPTYLDLITSEQERLRKLVQVFVVEKVWEGCKGLTVTDEMKVSIAGQACLLLLGIEHNYFSNVRSILIFPRQFTPARNEAADASGVVHQSPQAVLGQAWEKGPIILSWASSSAGGRNQEDGLNVVLHEFAHKLDLRDGIVNGTPPLKSRAHYARWVEVMQREYDILVEKTEKRKATLLDKYGATNPGEFFAVSVECFFEKPTQLRQKHPELYEVLRDYFNQDPAARSEGRPDGR